MGALLADMQEAIQKGRMMEADDALVVGLYGGILRQIEAGAVDCRVHAWADNLSELLGFACALPRLLTERDENTFRLLVRVMREIAGVLIQIIKLDDDDENFDSGV